jgi:uncharacterized DUF497 family protein
MFEWDAAKAAANLAKHGVPFEFGSRVFDDPHWLEIDVSRAVDGEKRAKAVGHIDGKLYAVVFTLRGAVRRIVSARRTNKIEERLYADRSHEV